MTGLLLFNVRDCSLNRVSQFLVWFGVPPADYDISPDLRFV